jgi:hypothetical protein
MMIVADKDITLILTGKRRCPGATGRRGAIGSGGNFALSAAMALTEYEQDPETIARKAMKIAADVCVYTNENLTLEKIEQAASDPAFQAALSTSRAAAASNGRGLPPAEGSRSAMARDPLEVRLGLGVQFRQAVRNAEAAAQLHDQLRKASNEGGAPARYSWPAVRSALDRRAVIGEHIGHQHRVGEAVVAAEHAPIGCERRASRQPFWKAVAPIEPPRACCRAPRVAPSATASGSHSRISFMPSAAMPSAIGWKPARNRPRCSARARPCPLRRDVRRQTDGQLRVHDHERGTIFGWKMIFFTVAPRRGSRPRGRLRSPCRRRREPR